MKVLFIGGTGIISSASTQLAIDKGIELYHLNRGSTTHRNTPKVPTLIADIRDKDSVVRALGDHQFDVVVNWIGFTTDHIQQDLEVFASRTKQYIFISSASAYQTPVAQLPVTESTPLNNPFWQYSRDKQACEELIQSFEPQHEFHYTIVRPSHTYDKTLLPNHGGFSDFRRLKLGKPVVIHGEGTSIWTLTHHKDFAVGLVGLLANEKAYDEVFHITNNELLTWNSIYEMLTDGFGLKRNFVHIPSETIEQEVPSLAGGLLGDKSHSMIFDNSKIKLVVPEFQPDIPYAQGVKEVTNWYKNNEHLYPMDEQYDQEMDQLITKFFSPFSQTACTILLLMSSLFVTSCHNNSVQQESTQENDRVIDNLAIERIDEKLSAFVNEGQIAGVSALVFEDGKEVYYNAFGFADRENEEAMQRNTIVQIYSMTKPVTGVALMQQYEQGKFLLDDPLHFYLPEFKNVKVYNGVDENGEMILVEPLRPILVRDITRHTAGFATNSELPGLGKVMQEVNPRDWSNSIREFSEKQASIPLQFQPGTQWNYGPSVDIQAALVEKLSGQPFDQYIQEHILDPLSMHDTHYFIPSNKVNRMAAMYLRDENTSELTREPDHQSYLRYTNTWNLIPGGWGLVSTIDNYMNFAQMLVNGGSFNGHSLLKPETIKLMASNHLDESIEERMWLPSKGQVGFGVDFAVRLREPANPEENNGVVGEFFWDGAASTLFWVDPVNQLTAVLFVQLRPFDQIGLHKSFRDAVYGAIE